MFERFSKDVRQAVVLAQEEARLFDHRYIGTEHLLAGLLRVEEGVAARVLADLGIEIAMVREQILQICGRGEKERVRQIPFTPRAKRVLTHSLEEAQSLGSPHGIGTEHVLLGVARENDSVGTRILLDLGAGPDEVRRRVLVALNDPQALKARAAIARQRLRAIEAQLSAFDRREDVARVVGEAADTTQAQVLLSRLLDLGPGQAEAILTMHLLEWTAAERARLQQERDMLRAELGSDN